MNLRKDHHRSTCKIVGETKLPRSYTVNSFSTVGVGWLAAAFSAAVSPLNGFDVPPALTRIGKGTCPGPPFLFV